MVAGGTGSPDGDGGRGNQQIIAGKYELFALIGALVRRRRFRDSARSLKPGIPPKWEEIPHRRDRADRTGLPVVTLIVPDALADLLSELHDRLKSAKPHGVRVSHVNCDSVNPVGSGGSAGSGGSHGPTGPGGSSGSGGSSAEGPQMPGEWGPENVIRIRKLLSEARNGFLRNFGVRDRRLRFPLFDLVCWLMDQQLDPADPIPDRTLRRRLKEQGLAAQFDRWSQGALKELPSKVRWKAPIWVLRCVVSVAFWAAVTGRVRPLSRRYWWFMHQPHLAPDMTSTFARFAGRLINDEWKNEAPEFVARLLVNSFLEDLRHEYRLRPWHVMRRRRMTYPVLLLDASTLANGGSDLLYLINVVRNQTGLFDPLLVVSASPELPPGTDASRLPRPAHEALIAYGTWQNKLLRDRRARRDNTWYLPLLIRLPAADEKAGNDARWGIFDGYPDPGREARPPALTSGWLRAAVAIMVLVGVVAWSLHFRESHCDTWDTDLERVGTECIGVSDGSTDLFQPHDAPIQRVVATVLAQNRRAEEIHRDFPDRPYITLVDLQAFTSADHTADGLTAEREGLEGVVVAQQRQLNKSGSSDPIVRVLIANAGNGMYQGARVARQLGDMTVQDPSLVGVVGLDMSSRQTVSTINALARSGLPSVASTLSEDSLASANSMYFQVAPQNQHEAAVVLAYARHRLSEDPSLEKSIRVYYSNDTADNYSLNLRRDVVSVFGAGGFQTSAIAFTPSIFYGAQGDPQAGDHPIGNAVAAGRDTCGHHGFVFFAGRGVPDYGDFLSGSEQCANNAVFIGDDDVSRYVANASLRGQYSRPYDYVSFAPAPIASPPGGVEKDFYQDLRQKFRFEYQPAQGRSLDGHAALSYDAAMVMITAAEYLREGPTRIPITPGNVWREITDIHSARTVQPGANKAISGATGTIDYGGDIARHVPSDKPVAILGVNNRQVDSNVEGFCGIESGRTPSSWCPSGR